MGLDYPVQILCVCDIYIIDSTGSGERLSCVFDIHTIYRYTHNPIESTDSHISLDGYCSTVQGLLDWFEVDLGFTELSFLQIDMCVLCDFVLYSRVSLSSCPSTETHTTPTRANPLTLAHTRLLVPPTQYQS